MQFVGKRTAHGCLVYYTECGKNIQLPLCIGEVNHSPDGFEWGYGGSGPSQLAYAILHQYSGTMTASVYYQDFKRDFIQNIHSDEWTIKLEAIDEWIARREVE